MSHNLAFAAYAGGPLTAANLKVIDLPQPTPGPTDLVVAVAAVGLNPVDEKMRAALAPQTTPRIFGYDATGTVVAVGRAVTAFAPGDRVMYAGTTQRPGSLQQYQAVAAALVAKAPANLAPAASAALPLVGLTAWELLFEKMHFTPAAGANRGRTLLIINGAGGVGTMLSQLAHWAGLTVAATASAKHFDWLRAHGVDHPLDYHAQLAADFRATGCEFADAVAILYATEPYLALASELVAPFGHVGALVTPQGPLDVTALKAKAASLDFEYMFAKTDFAVAAASQGQILTRLSALAEAGTITPGVTTTLTPLSLANVTAGLQQLATGHHQGKLTISGPFEA